MISVGSLFSCFGRYRVCSESHISRTDYPVQSVSICNSLYCLNALLTCVKIWLILFMSHVLCPGFSISHSKWFISCHHASPPSRPLLSYHTFFQSILKVPRKLQFHSYCSLHHSFAILYCLWTNLTDLHSFLQMSGMVFGSMIEADNRLRAHEWRVRQNKKIARDTEVWRKYEQEYGPMTTRDEILATQNKES